MKEYKLTVEWNIASAEYQYKLTEYRGNLPVATYYGDEFWAATNAEYLGIEMPYSEGDDPAPAETPEPTPAPEPETPEPEETPTPEPETSEPEAPENDLPETTT